MTLGGDDWLAGGGMFHVTGHGRRHLSLLGLLGVRVGDLLSLGAVDLGNLEVNLTGHQLALPPGYGLTSLISGPDLKV